MPGHWRRPEALVALVALAWFGAAAAQDLRPVVAVVKPSIVGIGTYQRTRRPPSALRGTGFVVTDGRHAITNAHVIPKALNVAGGEVIAVFTGTGRRVGVRPARVVAADPDHDIVVLAFEGAPMPALTLGDDREITEGEAIAFTGFPIGAVLGLYPVTHHGIVSAITPIAIPMPSPGALDSALIRRLRDSYRVFQLDATAYPGNSGSPLYRAADGVVVGVINSVYVKGTKETLLSDPSGITYAVPIRYARALLDKLAGE